MSANDKSFEMFASVLREYLPLAGADPLDPTARLVDLGLDSLNTVEILVRMEEEFNVQFPDEDLTVDTFASVGSLWSVLSALVDVPVGYQRS
jgi:acyl carrier protein